MIVIPADAQFLLIWSTLFVGLAMAYDLVERGFVEWTESLRLALAGFFVAFGVIAGISI